MNDEQQGLLMMYKDIAKIFDEHGIKYFGMFGTELGAVRHNGFIPWDNDIDLLVMSDDMPYIKYLLTENLDQNKYYFHDSRADCHPHVILRTDDFEKDLKDRKPYFIDLFLFYPYPNGFFRRKVFNAMATCSYVMVYALEVIKSFGFYRMLYKLPRLFEKIALMTVGKDEDKMAHFVPTFRNDLFETKDFKEPLIHKFEDTTMPIPMDWEKFLVNEFGNGYMTPPPPEKRTGAHGFPVGAYYDYILDKKDGIKKRQLCRNDGKLISVIIPVFNSEEHLYECIRHLKQQTYQNMEVIFVVDVRSEDRSYDELVRLSKSYQCIKSVISDDSGFLIGAITKGIGSSKGDYIWFPNVADCPNPFFIEEMLDIALDYGADSVACKYIDSYRQTVVEPSDVNYEKIELSGKGAYDKVSKGCIDPFIWNKLYKRELLMSDNGCQPLQFKDDREYVLHALRSSNKVVYCKKPLYSHYLRGERKRTT